MIPSYYPSEHEKMNIAHHHPSFADHFPWFSECFLHFLPDQIEKPLAGDGTSQRRSPSAFAGTSPHGPCVSGVSKDPCHELTWWYMYVYVVAYDIIWLHHIASTHFQNHILYLFLPRGGKPKQRFSVFDIYFTALWGCLGGARTLNCNRAPDGCTRSRCHAPLPWSWAPKFWCALSEKTHCWITCSLKNARRIKTDSYCTPQWCCVMLCCLEMWTYMWT